MASCRRCGKETIYVPEFEPVGMYGITIGSRHIVEGAFHERCYWEYRRETEEEQEQIVTHNKRVEKISSAEFLRWLMLVIVSLVVTAVVCSWLT